MINNGYITWANLAGDIHTVNLATPHHQQCDRPRSRAGGQSRRILRRRHPPSFGMDNRAITPTDGQSLDGITITTFTEGTLNLSNVWTAKVTLPYTGAPIQFQMETPGTRGISTTWWAE